MRVQAPSACRLEHEKYPALSLSYVESITTVYGWERQQELSTGRAGELLIGVW